MSSRRRILLRSKSVRILLGLGAGVSCAALLFLKLCYFGWQDGPSLRAGDHEVVFHKTVNSWNPLAFQASDGTAGYYRIFDKRGLKVFELFTDSHAFDVVLTGSKKVEFQLDGRTVVWRVPGG